MRLFVPEPQIELYEDGFDSHDILGRAETGKRLSELVENIDDPMVIALTGAWGSGKSFFLKCWVGEHLKPAYGHKAQTVYFDAFQHDYMDDPLIALTGVLAERFEKDASTPGKTALEKAKKFAPALARTAFRVGIAALTAGVVTKADDISDAAIEALGDEMSEASQKFWRTEDSRRDAMQSFREALTALTEPDDDGGPTKRFVIVVDELDRCRPDFALSLLEVVKHFFSIPGISFVLGANMDELENSVKARYGSGIDASTYLRKFYSLQLVLPTQWDFRQFSSPATTYFEYLEKELELDNSKFSRAIFDYIMLASLGGRISIRDVQHIATRAVVTLSVANRRAKGDWFLVAGLVVISVLRPQWRTLFEDGRLHFGTFSTLFRFDLVQTDEEHFADLKSLWNWAIETGELSELSKDQRQEIGQNWFPERRDLPSNPTRHIKELFKTYIDPIDISAL